MEVNQNEINIAYIGGGSMNFGWKFIGEICQEKSLCGTVRLYDVDKKLSLANEVIGNNAKNLPDCKTNMIFLSVDTLEEALRDADFVVVSILPGAQNEEIEDIHIPESYGINQICGDNSGPGGFMRAIRILPQYIELAEKIKELCPRTWVISLSDPMSACIEILNRAYPEINVVGCSNDVFSVKELLATIVSEKYGIQNVSIRDIKTNLLGINKFCWIDKVMYKGDNLFDIYAEYARKYADSGYEIKKQDYKSNLNAAAHKVQFDMFLRYGLIAASSDRHIAECCPPWYTASSKVASQWKLGAVTPSYLKKKKMERIAKCRKLVSGEDYLRIGWSGTDCVAIIRSLLGEGNLITNAVTINRGQIENLPLGCAVETNVMFSHGNVKPVFAGSIPSDVKVLMDRLVGNTEILVDAVMQKNIDYAFNSFLNNPLMTLDMDKAKELYHEMIKVNKNFLEYYL